MRKIEFIEDFANKKKGDVWEDCDDFLASDLVRVDKVAKFLDTPDEEAKPAKKSSKKEQPE